MGQRHQLFVIARIGKHYRSLAAIHHQWLYGLSALRSCLRLLRIFSDPSNQRTLKRELELAVAFFEKQGPPPTEPLAYVDVEKEICAFPFITTCLAIGASYDYERCRVNTVHELAYNTGYDQGDNNDGITVLDITDLSDVRYCFVTLWGNDDADEFSLPHHTPLPGRQYLKAYYRDSDDVLKQNAATIEALDKRPLIDVTALAATWPWGGWCVDKAAPESTETDGEDPSRGPNKSLRDLAAAKLFDRLLQSPDDEFDASLLDQVEGLPGFQHMLRQYLLDNPEQLGPSHTASAHLLQLAYAGETFLEWTCFANLPPKTIRAVLTSNVMKDVTGISLAPPLQHSVTELAEALSSIKNLQTCEILDRPDREDDHITKEVFEAIAKSSQPVAVQKLVLSGLYTYGLRQKLWRPYREHPKTPPAFPVEQLLVAYHGQDAEYMQASGGSQEYFYLGDAALSPVKIITGLFQYLKTQIRVWPDHTGTGLYAAHSFACSTPDLGEGDPLEIAPLPAEVHTIAKVKYHSSIFQGLQSKMRDLTPDAWTVLVSRFSETNRTDSETRSTTKLQLKYAFVKAKEVIQVDPKQWRGRDIQPSEMHVADLEGFLQHTAPGIDSGKLAYYLSEIETTLVNASNDRYCFVTPDNGPVLSLLTPGEACGLLNQFVASMPQMEENAQRACRWGNRERDRVNSLGFDANQPPRARNRGPVPVAGPLPQASDSGSAQ